MGDEDLTVPDIPDDQWPAPETLRGSRSMGALVNGWRCFSWRCGDAFAGWAMQLIARRRSGRTELLRAAIVAVQAAGFGDRARRAFCDLVGAEEGDVTGAPDMGLDDDYNIPEGQLGIGDFSIQSVDGDVVTIRADSEGVLADGLSEGGWVQLARAYRHR